MGRKNARSREDAGQQKKRSMFQSIEVKRADEEYMPHGIDIPDKIETKDKEKAKTESLPLVKRTHKGEDNITYEDKVQYALEELTEELGLSDYEVNDAESGVVSSRYKDVDISIEYLDWQEK